MPRLSFNRPVANLLRRNAHTQSDIAAIPTPHVPPSRSNIQQKKEGDISSVFTSLSGAAPVALPERFVHLKRAIIGSSPEFRDRLVKSWEDLLGSLETGIREIEQKGTETIPEVSFTELVSSQKGAWVDDVKKRGVVVVRDVVEDEQALAWKQQVKDYVAANPQVKGGFPERFCGGLALTPDDSKGFPADNKQVFEIYWSKAQVEARSHPNLLATQKALMSTLFHADPNALVSLNTPLTYADRLRIRLPGDSKFALGPHIDGGSLERWEDAPYRDCYREILSGNWRAHDAWDVGRRLGINSDIYGGPSQCSVFRAFQGWLSLSNTGPGEGTLRVFPLLKEASAYVLLRPFFRPTTAPTSPSFLSPSSWTIDTESPEFPNSVMGCAQELSDATHPHLRVDNGGVVSMKAVAPGDMVFWHCDGIHAVEKNHCGAGDSSVFYIPVTPLTVHNAKYIARQKEALVSGVPAPDFPGGDGEMGFKGVGTPADILSDEGERAVGLAAFAETDGMTEGEKQLVKKVNDILGF